MKRTVKWLISAALLTVIGAVISFSALAASGFNMSLLNTASFVENTYTLTESFNDISLSTDTADIILIPTQEREVRVVCYEYEGHNHSVAVKDGTLTLTNPANAYTSGIFNFTVTSPKISVYIPEGEYGTLKIETDTADVYVPKEFTFAGIDISTDTGDSAIYSSSKNHIKINTDTGDVLISGVNTDILDVKAHTADVTVSSVNCKGNASIVTTTGDLKVNTLVASSLFTSASTGDVDIKGATVAKGFTVERSTGDVTLRKCVAASFTVTTDTGDVTFEACDCAALSVTTSTGDVYGTLLSPKIFSATSRTGNVHTPTSQAGGLAVINCSTGDIYFEILPG